MTTTLPDALSETTRDFVSREHGLLIDGEWSAAADGRTFETPDPATGGRRVAGGGGGDVRAARPRHGRGHRERSPGGAGGHRPRRRRRPRRVRGRRAVARHAGTPARAPHPPPRRPDRGARGRALR